MIIRVIRKGTEIFAAGGNDTSLAFPAGTVLDSIELLNGDVRVILAEKKPVDLGVSYVERELFAAGKKIQAIKCYRERTGLGLKESKDAIEAACPPFSAPSFNYSTYHSESCHLDPQHNGPCY
jgi:hypothetical protein